MSSADVAKNIINQLGDLWSERIPSPEWVPMRQSTNDPLDVFVTELIEKHVAAERAEIERLQVRVAEIGRLEARIAELETPSPPKQITSEHRGAYVGTYGYAALVGTELEQSYTAACDHPSHGPMDLSEGSRFDTYDAASLICSRHNTKEHV